MNGTWQKHIRRISHESLIDRYTSSRGCFHSTLNTKISPPGLNLYQREMMYGTCCTGSTDEPAYARGDALRFYKFARASAQNPSTRNPKLTRWILYNSITISPLSHASRPTKLSQATHGSINQWAQDRYLVSFTGGHFINLVQKISAHARALVQCNRRIYVNPCIEFYPLSFPFIRIVKPSMGSFNILWREMRVMPRWRYQQDRLRSNLPEVRVSARGKGDKKTKKKKKVTA